MCGFVVVRDFRAAVDRDALCAAADVLSHRGPDGQTVWLAEDRQTGIGFNRLALVGPPDERQPFVSDDGAVTVVVNGEIYGYRDLRSELQRKGARFRTSSDCELILHAYLRCGTEFIADLNGEFAFVIWNQHRQEIVAARDRWGVKPLFYRETEHGIVLASEAKGIFAYGAPAAWDYDAVYQHLLASHDPGSTLFNGVRQLEPGYLMTVSGGPASHRRYWDVAYASGESDNVCEGAAAEQVLSEQLVDALQAAVADRFQGDHEVVSYLSGGVDSSSLAVLASGIAGTPQRAYTVDFNDGSGEAKRAGRLAAELGMQHHIVSVGEADLVEHLQNAVWHAETLNFNLVGVAKLLLSRRLQQDRFKVALTGDGADELFAGYGFSVMDAMSARERQQLQSMLDANSAALSAELGFKLRPHAVDRHPFAAGAVPFVVLSWTYERSVFRHLLREDFLAEQDRRNPYERLFQGMYSPGLNAVGGVKASLYVWLKTLFVNQILVAERLDMAHGVEARYPFLDNRVAAVAQLLPDHLLVSGYRDKYLLRQTIRQHLPGVAFGEEKRPFRAPPLALSTGGPFYQQVRDLIHCRALRESSIFDYVAVRSFLDQLPKLPEKTQQKMDAVVAALVSYCALQERFQVAG